MTRRLIAVEIDGTIMTLKGWQAHGLGLGAGIKTVYNGVQQGWVADSKRLADLLAYCQRRNIAVEIVGDQPGQTGMISSRSGSDWLDPIEIASFTSSRSALDQDVHRGDDQIEGRGGPADPDVVQEDIQLDLFSGDE